MLSIYYHETHFKLHFEDCEDLLKAGERSSVQE